MTAPKKAIQLRRANRVINNGCTVLISCQYNGPPNIITIAWQTPVSHNPPIMAIAVGMKRYSHDLIVNAGEFVVNVPNAAQLNIIEVCGRVSGREHNKFDMAKLTAIPAKIVSVPLIAECIAHLECKLVKRVEVGDHSVFFGEVVAASVGEGLFDEFWKLDSDQGRTVHHLGGQCYTVGFQRIQYNDIQK